jgi:hypothetical protein
MNSKNSEESTSNKSISSLKIRELDFFNEDEDEIIQDENTITLK